MRTPHIGAAMRPCLPVLFSLTSLVVALPAWGGSGQMECYIRSEDNDNDGYAKSDAVGYWQDRDDGLHCPYPGWVDKTGDCDDDNPFVHPRTDEIGSNSIDDDCSGTADEPVAYFAGASGFDRTLTSFGMVVRMNDALLENWASRNMTVRVEVEFAPLNFSNFVKRRFLPYAPDASPDLAHVVVTDLWNDTVYQAKARFVSCVQFAVTGGCRMTPWSNVFYGATGGDDWDGERRANVVSAALSQFNDSNYQLVGYGAGDGKRYGASYGEQWCSEFYSWVLDPYIKPWAVGFRPATVSALVLNFIKMGQLFDSSAVPGLGRRGDYLAMDTDGDGEANHSGMLLAWDNDRNLAWTVEGNSGNEVRVNQRQLDEIMHLGRLK